MGLRQKTIAGAAWMVSMQFTVTLLGLCSTLVLVRLLTPSDFGIVALAGTAYTFFTTFGQFGFDAALIQFRNPERIHYDTAWTCNILVALGVAVAMIVVARPAAEFYRQPRIEGVVYCFALLSLLKGFENIGVVNFRKSLTFRAEYLYFVLPKLSSIAVGVGMAFVLRSYWALVIGMLASQCTRLVYSYVAQPFRPRFSLGAFRELFQFTRWVLGSRIVGFLAKDGVDLMLGRLQDAAAVGHLGIARQIAFLPSTEILAPINRALFPSFSTISEDVSRLRKIFYKVFAMTALVSVPAAFGILALSRSFVYVAFGPRWQSVAPLLSILGFIGAIEAAKSLLNPLLLARGIPKVTTYEKVVYVGVVVPATVVLVNTFGTIGVAYAMLAASVGSAPIFFVFAKREVGVDLGSMLSYVWRPILASAAMALVVRYLSEVVTGQSNPTFAGLLLLVASGVVVYSTVLAALWLLMAKPDGAERVLIEMASAGFCRLRGRAYGNH